MFRARPIFGWGVGTFQIYFPRFRSSGYSKQGVSHNTQHAHNEYLEIATELGIIGLGAFLAVIILYFLQVHRALRTLTDVKPKLLLIGCSCGVLASLLHNLVSVSLRWPEPAIAFWFVFSLTTVLTVWTALQKPNVEMNASSLDGSQRSHSLTEEHQRNPIGRLTKAIQLFLLSFVTLVLAVMISAFLISDVYTGAMQRHFRQGKMLMAAQAARHACYWGPNPKAYYTLAATYFHQGYVEDAVRIYRQLEKIAPDYAQIHHNLASAYAALSQTDLATQEARKAVTSEDIPITRIMLADLLMKQGAWNLAEKAFQHALELDSDIVYAWERLGSLYSITEEYEKAIKCYQQVLESKTGSVTTRFGIAQCYEKLGQSDEARIHFRNIVEAHPEHLLAKAATEHLAQYTEEGRGSENLLKR